MTDPVNAPSTAVRRYRELQTTDPAVLDEVLADGLVAHVAFVRDGHPVVIPFGYGVGDLGDGRGRQLLLHGSTGGGVFLDARAEGIDVSVAITHSDGLVYARSLFDSSFCYRSAVVFGRAVLVPAAQKEAALTIISEHLMPGRTAEVRGMRPQEIAATAVLAVPLDKVSVKVSLGLPDEEPDDGEDRSCWAGVLPLGVAAAAPITSPGTPEGVEVPASVVAAAQRATAGITRTVQRLDQLT